MPTGQEVGVVARQNQEVRPTFVTLVAKQLALPGFQVCSGGRALEALDKSLLTVRSMMPIHVRCMMPVPGIILKSPTVLLILVHANLQWDLWQHLSSTVISPLHS